MLFARYAFPPNELGYCGPEGALAMLEAANPDDLERRARQFEGAWSYLELLAEAVGERDPLAVDVVDAYWVGSDLLDAIDPTALVNGLEQRFRGQPGGTWRDAATRARAHHSFQVFEVYPWAGLLRDGRPPGPAVAVLDRCRIRPGLVAAVDGESVTVTSRSLTWDGASLGLGDTTIEQARWSVDGRSLIASPVVGEVVALHWDWVCDVLTPEQALRVMALEESQRVAIGLSRAE